MSAADEKVLRVFGAPRSFVESARALHTLQENTHRTHVVALDVHADGWRRPAQLTPALEAAMDGRPDALAVLVFSADLDGEPQLALHDIEAFLQHVYTAAWALAVRQDRLRTDITVYLLPGAPHGTRGAAAAVQWAAAHATHAARAWTVGEAPAALLERVLRVPVVTLAPGASEAHAAGASAFPRAPTVALGGTFDHLHIGHKLLLSVAALCTTQRLIVGVTSTELLAKKKHRAYVEPIATRLAAVRRFLRAFRAPFGELVLDVVPISDVCGPAGTDPALDLLVVTEETAKGADVIADERRKNGVQPVQVHVVALVDAADHADKVGSTAIRGWLEARGVPPGHETPLDADLAAALAEGPAAANVPALGLSNRAASDAEAAAPAAQPFTTPPNPEQLQTETLWLEREKLYGHGYELLSVDVDVRTRLIASTCKATTPAHAVVRLFDGRERYKPLASVLEGHTLSVTRVRFAPDGRFVLTASRDRSWRLFERAGASYVPYAGERAHARIVWDAAWARDARTFATASRDKTVKVWRVLDDERRYALCATLALDDAATSVALADTHTLAVGLERGDVLVYAADAAGAWAAVQCLPRHHTGAVHDVAFRPPGAWQGAHNRVPYTLLSAGDDGCVRVVSFCL